MSTAGEEGGNGCVKRRLDGCCSKSASCCITNAGQDAAGDEGGRRKVERRLEFGSPGIVVAGRDVYRKARRECVVGCFSKSASPAIPMAGSAPAIPIAAKGRLSPWPRGPPPSRHFEFPQAEVGLYVTPNVHPIRVVDVKAGTPAHASGVRKGSILYRVNGRTLLATDGEKEREEVRMELKQRRPLSLDVVQGPPVRGLPAVPVVAGADAGAGVGRGTLVGEEQERSVQLIRALPQDEQEIVARVLFKLVQQRASPAGKDQESVLARLRELV